jgi:hypothetical protein
LLRGNVVWQGLVWSCSLTSPNLKVKQNWLKIFLANFVGVLRSQDKIDQPQYTMKHYKTRLEITE